MVFFASKMCAETWETLWLIHKRHLLATNFTHHCEKLNKPQKAPSYAVTVEIWSIMQKTQQRKYKIFKMPNIILYLLACFAHRDVTHSKCLALPQKTQCIMYAQVLPDTSFLISERNSNTRSQMGYFPRNSRMEKHQPALQYYRKFGNIFKKKKKAWQWEDLLIVFQTT